MNNKQRIAKLAEKISELCEEKYRLECEEAEAMCPFKIGDIVTNRKHVKARVINIRPYWTNGYECDGVLIKKDGTDGRNMRLYSWDEWKLMSEPRASTSNAASVKSPNSRGPTL